MNWLGFKTLLPAAKQDGNIFGSERESHTRPSQEEDVESDLKQPAFRLLTVWGALRRLLGDFSVYQCVCFTSSYILVWSVRGCS